MIIWQVFDPCLSCRRLMHAAEDIMSRAPSRFSKTADQPYVKSPLSQQVEFRPRSPSFDEAEYDRHAITFTNSVKSAPFGLLPDTPPYTPTWTEKPTSHRPPHKRHRRIDTVTLIAMATKPYLTPHRLICLFAVVCAASYLARLLPLLVAPSWQDPRYNPGTIHRPPAVFEALSFNPSAAGALRRTKSARAPVRRPVLTDENETGTHPAARMRVIRPQAQAPLRRPDNWQLPVAKEASQPEALGDALAHDHKLSVVVLDGVERAQHEEVEAMKRTEAGLRDADDEDEERKSFERIMIDLGQEEDEAAEGAADSDWLEEELQEDENEDVPLVAEASEADEEQARKLPMPMQSLGRRPVSDYLAQRKAEEDRETLFEGET
jgi:hypothetical protein